ncbi:class I SAM-dependent methyltransferase [Ruegeria marisrubri]|uniref:class I SAM-dependent methyltransferase n=1 Tax=Ruegeria marisrubri TaxID=1685379 RepID=UPI001CD4F6C9|nr:class I SAM-dependent methyltransferase [Ruegeria marisrubri]MCA0908463.1 class I SAM-dependent methyltransferase [Ruegeria marisrubri]
MLESKSYQAYMNSPYKSSKHSTYFDVYDKLFSPYIGKDITFVEIGVLGGGSLFMWREFFGPQARIIGVELNPDAKRWEQEGFEIFIGSQSDPDFLEKIVREVGDIDIVLDDGGHTYEQQIITTECLLPHIKDGGMLVVEDTHTSYMEGFGLRHRSFIKYAMNMVDRINHRFSRLTPDTSEKRVWGISFFESFVVFDVNRKATSVASAPTENAGEDLHAKDFRHADNQTYEALLKTSKGLSALKAIPGMRAAARLVRNIVSLPSNMKRARRLKEYF